MSEVILINLKTAERQDSLSTFIPPLNILRLASVLIAKGYGVNIIDQIVEPGWKEELKKYLKKGPICVGVSSLSGTAIKFGLEASMICKDYNIKTVWGGVHPTKAPYSTIKNKYVDFVIKGEGEFSFCNLVEALEAGRGLSDTNGLLFKHAGEIKETPDSPAVDLNTLPRLPFDLLDLDKYHRKVTPLLNFSGLILPLETSRGCPFNCRFCSKIHNSWRAVSADKIIDDLKYIRDHFTKNVVFFDENFFVDLNRTRSFMDLIKKERIDMNLYGNPRIDALAKNPGLLDDLEACGFKTLFLAIDGTSQKMLDFINKQLTLPQIFSVSRNLNKRKIIAQYSLLTGLPYESLKDVQEGFLSMLKLLMENKNARVAISRFMPTPGIGMLKECIELGFREPAELEAWATYSPSMRSKQELPWLDDNVRVFLERFDYIPALFNLRISNFPLANQAIWLLGNLMKLRIKNNYYKFNFERKIANTLRDLCKK